MNSEKKRKKEKRSSRKCGKKYKKWRNGKPKAEQRLLWKPPKQPLGEMIEGRFFVLKRLYRRRMWLCFDLQENRDVVVKTENHKRSKKGKNVKGRTPSPIQFDACPGKLGQKQPLKGGQSATPILLDERKNEINDLYPDLMPPLTVKEEGKIEINDLYPDLMPPLTVNVEENQHLWHAPSLEDNVKEEIIASPLIIVEVVDSPQESRAASPIKEKHVEGESDALSLIGSASPLLASKLNNQIRETYINLTPQPIVHDVENQQLIRATSSIAENLLHERLSPSPLLTKVMENQQLSCASSPLPSASPLLVDMANNEKSGTYPYHMPEHVIHVGSPEEAKLEEIEASFFLSQVKDILENKTRRITNEKKKVKYPVKLGDLLDNRYFVEEKFWVSLRCAVWLCWDLSTKCKVVLKMSTSHLFESLDFRDELDMLEMVHSQNAEDPRKERIIKVLGDFEFMPTEQRRFCIVLESMYCDLSHLLEAMGRLPLGLIRAITKQILEGLEYLHSCDIIHTDIKPANIVLSWEKDMQSLSVKIIDFGNACLNVDKAADEIQTPPYRSPEVWLKICYDTPADIWSTACLIFELAAGQLLFNTADNEDYSRCEDHLAAIMELLGPIPRKIISQSELEEEYFDKEGQLIKLPELNELNLEDTLVQTYHYPPQSAKELAEFLKPMLELEPTKRATATQCLQHPWLNGHKGITNANELREENVEQEEMEQDN